MAQSLAIMGSASRRAGSCSQARSTQGMLLLFLIRAATQGQCAFPHGHCCAIGPCSVHTVGRPSPKCPKACLLVYAAHTARGNRNYHSLQTAVPAASVDCWNLHLLLDGLGYRHNRSLVSDLVRQYSRGSRTPRARGAHGQPASPKVVPRVRCHRIDTDERAFQCQQPPGNDRCCGREGRSRHLIRPSNRGERRNGKGL
jgi:hypothetical protein